jgi:Fe-S-cluster containining protein
LLQPGDPSFVCLIDECPSHCCKIYSVSLGEREKERMARFSGLEPVEFLEVENGEPIHLPLSQPYLLSRTDGHCSQLGEGYRCGQYEGRPDACRQYPHHVLFVDPATGKPTHGDTDAMAEALGVVNAPEGRSSQYIPLLMRHIECPGFDQGPPLGEAEWLALLNQTAGLQYPVLAGHER